MPNSLAILPKVTNTSKYDRVTLPFVQVFFSKLIFITNHQAESYFPLCFLVFSVPPWLNPLTVSGFFSNPGPF